MTAFSDFFAPDWGTWKLLRLLEARKAAQGKTQQAGKAPPENDEASYAFGGNQSKTPLTWDQDDWKYLIQFPPRFWAQAMTYRYNTGLAQAAKLRMDDPQHSLDVIPDTVDNLTFTVGKKRYVFKNVWVGFKQLINKLEKPIRYNAGHNPTRDPETEGQPGIQDVNVNDDEDFKRYKGGLHDYDLTYPIHMSDEDIDDIPDHEVPLDKGVPRTPENVEKARDRMRGGQANSFAGMGVLKPARTLANMANWYKAQALGLLGDAPATVADPYTGQQVPVQTGLTPKDMNMGVKGTKKAAGEEDYEAGFSVGKGDNHAFHDPAGGHQIRAKRHPLTLPAIRRTVHYDVIDSKGVSKPEKEDITVPVLNPGRLLPRIVDLSPEQREIIAKRANFDVAKQCGPGLAGRPWAEVEAMCQKKEGNPARNAGAPRDLSNLMSNWDILTPAQKTHLVQNARHMKHYVASEFGNLDDPWSKLNMHYVAGGFSPNKGQKKLAPLDMTPEQKQQLVAKYLGPLTWEADDAISDFLRRAEKYGKLPKDVINIIDKAKTDLAVMAGALNLLNLNHPRMGIRDEALGLTNVQPNEVADDEGGQKADSVETSNQKARKMAAMNLARDVAQAAFGDIGSRRQRRRAGGTVSYDAETPDGASLGQNIGGAGGQAGDRGVAAQGSNRGQRAIFQRDTSGGDGEYNLASPAWNIQGVGSPALDRLFKTYRNKLTGRLGSDFGQYADRAAEKMKLEVGVMQGLFDDAVKELHGQVPAADLERQANALAAGRLAGKLKELRPDLYGKMDDRDMENLIGRNRGVGLGATADEQAEEDRRYTEFFTGLIHGRATVPQYDREIKEFVDGPTLTLDMLKDPNDKPLDAHGVLMFMRAILGDHAAQKFGSQFAVPLLAAVNQHFNFRHVSESDMIHAVREAGQAYGIVPAQVPTEETGPAPARRGPKPKAPAPATAQAGTDISALIAQLPAHPELAQQIMNSPDVAAHADQLRQAGRQLGEIMNTKEAANQNYDAEETALLRLGRHYV